jgi:hypothetical protein
MEAPFQKINMIPCLHKTREFGTSVIIRTTVFSSLNLRSFKKNRGERVVRKGKIYCPLTPTLE